MAGDISVAALNKKDCTYTSCYCEENVYLLCERFVQASQDLELDSSGEGHQRDDGRDPNSARDNPRTGPNLKTGRPTRCWAIWVSNEGKSVAVWCQKRAAKDQPVFWDYHVICAAAVDGEEPLVYDLDSTLDFPCPLSVYVKHAFRPCAPRFAASFRVVVGDDFVRSFSSDRSHMLSSTGSFLAPPPSYDCILNGADRNNVMKFVDMTERRLPGRIVDVENLVACIVNENDGC